MPWRQRRNPRDEKEELGLYDVAPIPAAPVVEYALSPNHWNTLHGAAALGYRNIVVRLLVDNPGPCKDLLVQEGFYVVEAEVFAVNLTDRRGKLAAVTRALAAAKLNIDYAYSTVDHQGAHTLLVMKIANPRMAEEILAKLSDD